MTLVLVGLLAAPASGPAGDPVMLEWWPVQILDEEGRPTGSRLVNPCTEEARWEVVVRGEVVDSWGPKDDPALEVDRFHEGVCPVRLLAQVGIQEVLDREPVEVVGVMVQRPRLEEPDP